VVGSCGAVDGVGTVGARALAPAPRRARVPASRCITMHNGCINAAL